MHKIQDPTNASGIVMVERQLLLPEYSRSLTQDPASDSASIATSTWAQDTSATGGIPTKRKSILKFRHGWNNTGFDWHVVALVQRLATSIAVTNLNTLKSRFAVYLRDYPWEISNSVRGLPNSTTPLFTTGLGISFSSARSAWSSATGASGTLAANLRYDVSGGLGIIPAGSAFTIARLDECAYTNAGITPSPEAPTTGIFQTSTRGCYGTNLQNRLNSAQYNQRPQIYINALLGDGLNTGIDDIDFSSATAMNGEPIGNWTNMTEANGKLQGTTHLSGVSSTLATGNTVTLTSGVVVKDSSVWWPIEFLCNIEA